ncbi:nucleotidyltransferase family protein [Shewanella sp. HN-41]|uniref:nucleotidyltransferase family protein n=1 Tax=Shewanella sp. HN-41 TaxID=327275 RepID=UPI0002125B31|nr:nucleotidyltransferase family protein [Shewanella sp. HN-41]EGM70649.1 hypothetical protein SOHN41_01405 [Shewanella sp. HN-41]
MIQGDNSVPYELELQARLLEWIIQDSERSRVLQLAAQCAAAYTLPQWCLAAGFVRNLVWDRLHGFESSPLNDIDLIYYCPLDTRPERDRAIEAYLYRLAPELPWSVKNQARMHLKNRDAPYISCLDAMAHWPELETAVGICYSPNGLTCADSIKSPYMLITPFGLQSLFALKLSPNPRRALAVCQRRIAAKGWLSRYPLLCLA